MTIDDDSQLPPKRRVGALAKERAARALVQTTNEKLSGWQAEAARLAELSRRASRPDIRLTVAAAARSLMDAVTVEAEALAETIRAQGDGLVHSSRVTDTRQALDSIRRRLAEILGGLQA